jgi:Pre-toxin TG
MPIVRQLRQYAGRRITRRLYRTLPWLGGALALVTLGSAMRRKGAVGGLVDTALDFVPVVGGVKNLVEIRRGRDLIPDKQPQ